MKLLKLSLATALTAGALATTSFATPLEEAIKNVDVSGYAKLQHTWDKEMNKSHSNSWQVKGHLNFKTKFDDNFFGFAGLEVKDRDSKQSGAVSLYNGYLGYTNGGTTLLAGRYTLGTFFTDDLWGSGVKVVNSDVDGLTLAALWADNLNLDDDVSIFAKSDEIQKALGGTTPNNKDLFGLAALGSFDPVNFQLWYAKLSKIADLYAAQLGFDFDLGNDAKVSLLGQYGQSKLTSKIKDLSYNNGKIYALQLSTSLNDVDLAAGYVNFSTKDNKNSLVTLDDKGQFVNAGELTDFGYNGFMGKHHAYYTTLGFEVPDTGFNLGADYVHAVSKTSNKDTTNELVGRVGYDFNKKLSFTSYYAHLKEKHAGSKNELKFQVKYSF